MESFDDILARHGLDARNGDAPRRRRARPDDDQVDLADADPRTRRRRELPDNPEPRARRARHDTGSNRLDGPRSGLARHDSGEFRTPRERTSGSTPLEGTRTGRRGSTTGRNRRTLPDGAGRPARDQATTALPAAERRTRHAAPEDDPATTALPSRERRRTPRRPADPQPATTALPVERRNGRRALPDDPPSTPTRRRAPRGEQPATTALPAERRRGRRALPDDPPSTAADDHPATTALPARERRGRRALPDEQPSGPTRRATPDEQPATTALPAGERRSRRALPDEQPSGSTRRATPDEQPATPGLPVTPRRTRRQEPAGDAPAGRSRRAAEDDLPATTALPAGAATTAIPTSAARRSSRSSAEQTTTALRSVTPRKGTPKPDQPSEQTTTRVRVDRPETGSRAHRIDETLTRITAAHAGLALAVRDGKEAPEAKVKRSRMGRLGRLLVLAMSVLVLGASTFGYGTKLWLGSSVRTVAALDLGAGAIVDAAAQQGDTNVLVVATDPAAPKDAGNAPGGGTVAVVHVPVDGGSVTALSIPTDLEINRPPCDGFDRTTATYTSQTVRAEARTRLATAYDEGGPRCAVRVVQQLTGIAITKFVAVDLGRIGAAVDAVGGVDVCVPRPVLDATLGPVVPDAGTRRLDGVRAGDFVRAANVDGDPPSGQVQRQQQVLAAVLGAALGGAGPLEVGKIAALRKALDGAIITDKAGIDELQALALSLRKLDTPGVTFAAVPTAPEANARGNSVIRDTDAAAVFAAIRKDAKLPAGADARAAGKGPSPADVTVEVINGSTRSGLAGKVGDTLKSLGFSVSEVANAKQPTPKTLIRFSPDQAAAAGLLASTVPAAEQVPNPGSTGVLQLVLGRSFDDVVRAPVALRAESPKPAGAVTASCA